ncbi:DUF4139 domain-containing protein [Thioclava sp. GXIMD4215]|uniref:DUF4139 domain-containing protein n=1 Tax=Thioclava sp. GXIMD4215 TaxID=3131928 RepID=UPI003243297C
MRLIMAGLVVALPQTVWAEDLLQAQIRRVTLYPQGAEVTRQVQVPDGAVTVRVAGLPASLDLDRLRIAGEGVSLSGVRLVSGQGAGDSPVVQAARAKLAQMTEDLAQKEDAVALLRAKAEAALDRVVYLRGIGAAQATPEQALAIGDEVEARALAARQTALHAQAEARRAEAALAPDRRALQRAQDDLAQLLAKAENGQWLEATASGHGVLTLTSFADDAGWSPVYDMRLDRGAKRIDLTRLVSVHQSSGEDWHNVDLTLSTARPNDRMDPSELWPLLRSVGPDRPVLRTMGAEYAAAEVEAAPMRKADLLAPQMEGVSLVYHLPQKVDMRDKAEALRLKMDDLSLKAASWAEAVPSRDPTAYLVAEATNSGSEPILPGPVMLYADGRLVGQGALPLTMPGQTVTQGFGAIDGLVLTRKQTRQSGDRGVIARRNEQVETVRMTVENQTDQSWPLRVVDQVPYSEQDDLKISWNASPEVSQTDLDDKTGLLGWRFDLPAQASRDITLTTRLEWPADQVLH